MTALPRQRRPAAPLVALLSALTCSSAQAQVAAIALTEPGAPFESAPYTLGFAFSVNTPLRLAGLGVYDHDADGLESAAQAGPWRDGRVDTLALAEVPAGTAAPVQGLFSYAPVVPLDLMPGNIDVVAAHLDGGTATSFDTGQGGQATVDGRITLLGDRYADGFFSIAYPTQRDGWLGAKLLLAPVPEPGPAGLLAASLAGLAFTFTRKSRNQA